MIPPKLLRLNPSQIMGRVTLRPAARDEILDLVIASPESIEDHLSIIDRDVDLGHGRTIDLVGGDRNGLPVFFLVSREDESEAGVFLRALDVPVWVTETQTLLERVYADSNLNFDGTLRVLVVANSFSPDTCTRVENLLGFAISLVQVRCLEEGGRLGLLCDPIVSSMDFNGGAGDVLPDAALDGETGNDLEDFSDYEAGNDLDLLDEVGDEETAAELASAPFLEGDFALPSRESDLSTFKLPRVLEERDRELQEASDAGSDEEGPEVDPDPEPAGEHSTGNSSGASSTTPPPLPEAPAEGSGRSGGPGRSGGSGGSGAKKAADEETSSRVQTLPATGADPLEELMEDGARRITALSDRIECNRSPDLVRFLLDGRILAEIRKQNDALEVVTDPSSATRAIHNASDFELGLNRIITKFFRLEEKGPAPSRSTSTSEADRERGGPAPEREEQDAFRPAKLTEEELAELFADDSADDDKSKGSGPGGSA